GGDAPELVPPALHLADRLLELGPRLLERDLELGELRVHVVLGLQPELARLLSSLGEQALGLLLRRAHDLLLAEEPRPLDPGPLHDLLAALARLREELLAVLHDPPRLLDLLRQLLARRRDDLEHLVAVHEHARGERHRLRLVDELLELLQPRADVHALSLRAGRAGPGAARARSPAPGRTRRRRTARPP